MGLIEVRHGSGSVAVRDPGGAHPSRGGRGALVRKLGPDFLAVELLEIRAALGPLDWLPGGRPSTPEDAEALCAALEVVQQADTVVARQASRSLLVYFCVIHALATAHWGCSHCWWSTLAAASMRSPGPTTTRTQC